ncbi:MAG: hypothetical protein ABJF10_06290 [Chthoniobacter sp.]|uniref:hypothetical protein n=1 Tax=Chthoniobacter sp. TaxID=2510640 RepID=UPI0032A69A6E
MSAQTTARRHGHSTNSKLLADGIYLLEAIQWCRDEPLASFLSRLRLLPLGVPGITALAALDPSAFIGADWLLIPSLMKRHQKSGYSIRVPNVFKGLDADAIQDFLRAAKDPAVLRKLLMAELQYYVSPDFSMRSLARLFEARLHECHSPLLIRVCNFRGQNARWPMAMLEGGTSWICSEVKLDADPAPRCPKGRASLYHQTRFLVRRFRKWAGKKDPGVKFTVSAPNPKLRRDDSQDWSAYELVTEIIRMNTGSGHSGNHSSLARYLREIPRVLAAERKKAKPTRVSQPMKEAHRLMAAARTKLSTSVNAATKGNASSKLFAGPPPERELKLNLIPFGALETMLLHSPATETDLQALTAFVIHLVDVYSGRRLSDFASTALRDIVIVDGATDFTIVATKNTHAPPIHLPLHKLVPAEWQPLVRTWYAASQAAHPEEMTPYELLTGYPPPPTRDDVRAKLNTAFKKLNFVHLDRHHQVRYAFASWAVVAVELARDPWLLDDSRIQAWIGDSPFFAPAHLAHWLELLGSRTNGAFDLVARILGHSSTDELQVDYCISWPILILISSLRAERWLTRCARNLV